MLIPIKKVDYSFFHIVFTMLTTISFAIFFQQEWASEFIRQNASNIPSLQQLSYGILFGIWFLIFTYRILRKPNPYLNKTKLNCAIFLGMGVKDFTTIFLDLVAITVIVHACFMVAYELDENPIFFWSTFCSLTVFPYLAFFTNWIFKNQKLQFSVPIFTEQMKK